MFLQPTYDEGRRTGGPGASSSYKEADALPSGDLKYLLLYTEKDINWLIRTSRCAGWSAR